jgi:hypothetical protein
MKNPQQFGLTGRAKMIFNNIKNAIARGASKIMDDMFTTTYEFSWKADMTLLELTCMRSDKGTSFIYKQHILRTVNKRQIMVAPAYYTWPTRFQHNMTPDEWSKALENINQYYISPCARWCAHQIFLRTIWTPLKESEASNGTKTPECPNCVEPKADTLHMFLYCPLAKRIWQRIGKILIAFKGK